MRRLAVVAASVSVVMAVTGFAGDASGGTKLQYLRVYHHAQKCGGKRAPGRNILHWGVSPGHPAKRTDLLRSIEVLRRMCAAPLVPAQALPQQQQQPTSYTPSSGGGGGGGYCGAYQFDQQTWQSVGGTGSACGASPAEQDKRAAILHQRRGNAPWPVCGRGGASMAQIRQCENGGRYR